MTLATRPISTWQTDSERNVAQQLAAGLPVVVSGVATAAGHGFIVFAAHFASTETTAFTIRHSSGFLEIALPAARCEQLLLPPMNPFDTKGTRMCVGVDAVRGTGTGISAADRATTARALMNATAVPDDFTRPGHLVPVCVDHDDADTRSTAASIALDLTRRAGLPSGALFAGLVGITDSTLMMNHSECVRFAETHDIPLITAP